MYKFYVFFINKSSYDIISNIQTSNKQNTPKAFPGLSYDRLY